MNLLSQLSPPFGSRRKSKRVGRGTGSGNGKTCGKGHKGQKSRSGPKIRAAFEGGQMPLNRRLPKRGFRNPFKRQIATVNLDALERMAGEAVHLDMNDWVRDGIVKNARDGVKILGRGEMSRAMTVRAHYFSEAARKKILSAGGKPEEII